MVRVTGVEPACCLAQEPKSCVSANSTIPAYVNSPDKKEGNFTLLNFGGAQINFAASLNGSLLIIPNYKEMSTVKSGVAVFLPAFEKRCVFLFVMLGRA